MQVEQASAKFVALHLRHNGSGTVYPPRRLKAGVAAEFGRRTGTCCFCAKTLTDPVSIEVGYGPVCAETYSLPHRATGLRPGMRKAA